MTNQASFSTEGIFSPDNLIAGNAHLLIGRKITIKSGAIHKRGEILGKITASGKYILSLAAATDGSELPDLILAEDVDASAADVDALAYARGDFSDVALILGTGHTLASITEGLRAKGITIIAVLS